jgi:hypothetical protein
MELAELLPMNLFIRRTQSINSGVTGLTLSECIPTSGMSISMVTIDILLLHWIQFAIPLEKIFTPVFQALSLELMLKHGKEKSNDSTKLRARKSQRLITSLEIECITTLYSMSLSAPVFIRFSATLP